MMNDRNSLLNQDGTIRSIFGLSNCAKGLFVLYVLVSVLYTLIHVFSRRDDGSVGYLGRRFRSPWESISHSSDFLLEDGGRIREDSKAIFSKMFQYALQPTEVVPYFFKRDYIPTAGDITITTLITMERLSVFDNLVSKFQGIFHLLLMRFDGG